MATNFSSNQGRPNNNRFGNNSNYNRSQAPTSTISVTEAKKLDKKTYVAEAEKAINSLIMDNGNIEITTNQIRNILSLVNELYDMVRTDTDKTLSDDVQSHAQYVKMKIIYAAGREKKVRSFLENSLLISYLNGVGDSRDDLIIFCHYMEALVAYHKFYAKEN